MRIKLTTSQTFLALLAYRERQRMWQGWSPVHSQNDYRSNCRLRPDRSRNPPGPASAPSRGPG